jgi:hypothetical protein
MHRYLLLLCSFPFLIAAQARYTLNDSLTTLLRRDSAHIYRQTLAKPYLKIDNRNSFILNQPVDFYGGMVGATFWNRHTLAVGYYFLDKKSRRPLQIDKLGSTREFIRLSYFNFAYQLVLFNKGHVQLQMPLEIGVGNAYLKRTETSSTVTVIHRAGRFIPYSAGIQVIGKITAWLGVSITGGYRYVVNDELQLRVNGFYYSFGIWVDARHLFRNYRYSKARKHYRQIQQGVEAK